MRIASIDNIKEGDILGKSIYSNNGGLLLSKGTKFSNYLINKLKLNNNIFVYIDYELSKDIEPQNAIDEEEKAMIVTEFKSIMDKSLTDPTGLVRKEVYSTVSNIVNKLIESLASSSTKIFYTMELMGTDM